MPYVDDNVDDIALPPIHTGQSTTAFDGNLRLGAPKLTWLNHNRVYEPRPYKEDTCQLPTLASSTMDNIAEDIKLKATSGVYPIFYEKDASLTMQKHAYMYVHGEVYFLILNRFQLL